MRIVIWIAHSSLHTSWLTARPNQISRTISVGKSSKIDAYDP